MRKLPAPSAAETLKVHAVSRLMLDNIPHIKAFWIATGVDVAQTALWFGVDDLDGTVQEEKIYHMAGSPTPEGLTMTQLTASSGRPAGSRSSATRFTTSRQADFRAELFRGSDPGQTGVRPGDESYQDGYNSYRSKLRRADSPDAGLAFFTSRLCEKFHKAG